MRLICKFIGILAIFTSISCAQLAVEAAEPDIKLMQDSTTNKPMKMDFSLPLVGISDPSLLFSHYSNKPLLIYFFSPKCPHCQRHMPEIQELMKEYEKASLVGIAIGIGGGIKKNDIRSFIDQYKVSVPVFQDADYRFAPLYGTGYIPVVYLVNKDGTFYRYETVNDENVKHMRATLDKMFKK